MLRPTHWQGRGLGRLPSEEGVALHGPPTCLSSLGVTLSSSLLTRG